MEQVSMAESKQQDGGVQGAGPERPRALFFMNSSVDDRILGGLLREMLGQGNDVVVALGPHKGGHAMIEMLDDLHEHFPRFGYQQMRPRRGPWRIPAGATQRGLDYLRLVESETADPKLRDSAREGAPRLLRALLVVPPFRWRSGRRMLGWLLRHFEAGMPLPRDVKSLIKQQAPDVVIVSDLTELDSPRGEFIRTAEAARVPSVLIATSWGDVPAERVLRDLPTVALVSAEEQTAQPAHLHGLPSERIETVGSQSFNGVSAPAPSGSVAAIENAAQAQVMHRGEGRLLRPILWLLTPLLVILLPVLRPRATLRDVTRFFRRIRRGGSERRRARAKAASAQRHAEASARKRARAEEKRQRRSRQREAKQGKAARVEAKGPPRSEPGEVKPQASPQEETQNSEAPEEQAKAGAEPETDAGKTPR